jgi:general secretion pathway protein E
LVISPRHQEQLAGLDPSSDAYAVQLFEWLVGIAIEWGASDIHIEKSQKGLNLKVRSLGRLHDLGQIPDGQTTQLLGRVKALARLVSYRSDIPQEGRLTLPESFGRLEARVGTLPLLDGERAVIRLSQARARQWVPENLGLPEEVLSRLKEALRQPSGVILITGAAGTGKTTTAYACMRWLANQSQGNARSLVSLEDPVENNLFGVCQSQVNPALGYSWEEGLKAILRQDPEVLLIGEIRDDATARVVFQAAMSGQLVLSTLHARSAADGLRRLLDMQVPMHHLHSCLEFLVCQRLGPLTFDPTSATNDGSRTARLQCELLPPIEADLVDALYQRCGSKEIEQAARRQGMKIYAEQNAWDEFPSVKKT